MRVCIYSSSDSIVCADQLDEQRSFFQDLGVAFREEYFEEFSILVGHLSHKVLRDNTNPNGRLIHFNDLFVLFYLRVRSMRRKGSDATRTVLTRLLQNMAEKAKHEYNKSNPDIFNPTPKQQGGGMESSLSTATSPKKEKTAIPILTSATTDVLSELRKAYTEQENLQRTYDEYLAEAKRLKFKYNGADSDQDNLRDNLKKLKVVVQSQSASVRRAQSDALWKRKYVFVLVVTIAGLMFAVIRRWFFP
jgi:hypothetical protein